MSRRKTIVTTGLLVGGGLSLLFGLMALIWYVTLPLEKGGKPITRTDSALIGARVSLPFWLLGIPSTGAGAWLLYTQRRQQVQAQRDRLQAAFQTLLASQGGKISVRGLAQEARCSAFWANDFLVSKAQELNGQRLPVAKPEAASDAPSADPASPTASPNDSPSYLFPNSQ
ncbi:hypothetical protein [Geitlerinema sp. PCC 7407]|uniref:hypothetical protein n=1 Tax=Geitlerinema sp. PCC 7407 TaxID=1173025 RepID=UPI00029F8168|nr:hypothetical protein [Geitlerinema sp. PCC 7407]AFY68283.1 hypothetical protein GEI7407_3816 [Geitlerinema sp. PCC 7407]